MIAALRTRVRLIQNTGELPAAMKRLVDAQHRFAQLSQKETDHIFSHVATNMKKHSFELAKYAVAESGIGQVADKTAKNLYGCEYTYRKFKDVKTAGLIYSDPLQGIQKYALPVGPICGLVPCTNPTATVIIKGLSALKTRNSIVFLPHPRTVTASAYAAKLMHDYAVQAGAPEDVVMCGYPDRDVSHDIMHHPDIKFLLATGGSAMIDACYSAKKPTIAVGPGNAPVMVDVDYDLKEAVNSIVIGKTFDNGTICAGEQNVIFPTSVYDKAKLLMEERGIHVLDADQKEQLGKHFMPQGIKGIINPDIVGKSACVIAELAGIHVPDHTLVLGVECENAIDAELFSHEKLSPILGIFQCDDFEHGVQLAHDLVEHGGKGHTAAIYSHNERHIEAFQHQMNAYHVVVNMPSSLGVIGIRYNTGVDPTMTVGVGAHGGSIASENVSCKHLMQVKVVNRKMALPVTFKLPNVYRGPQAMNQALETVMTPKDPQGRRKVVMLGTSSAVEVQLRNLGADVKLVETPKGRFMPSHSLQIAQEVCKLLREHRADTLVAVGNESNMNNAKLARVLYDNPDVTLDDLCQPFMEFGWRQSLLPLQNTTSLVCIPSGSGGSGAIPAAVSNVIHRPTGLSLQGSDIIHPSCVPDTIIVDTSLLKLNPQFFSELVFVTKVKALEAYISSINSVTAKTLAKEQLKRLVSIPCVSDECQSQLDLIYGACVDVEACVNNTAGPGMVSVIADVVAHRFNVMPAQVMAAALPHVIALMAAHIPTRTHATPNVSYVRVHEELTALAHELGLESYHDLVERILTQHSYFKTLAHHGINVDDYCLHLPQMAEEVFTHPLGKGAPRVLLLEEIVSLMHKLV